MSKDYPLHPQQTHAEPLYRTIPLDEYEAMKKRVRHLRTSFSQFRKESAVSCQ